MKVQVALTSLIILVVLSKGTQQAQLLDSKLPIEGKIQFSGLPWTHLDLGKHEQIGKNMVIIDTASNNLHFFSYEKTTGKLDMITTLKVAEQQKESCNDVAYLENNFYIVDCQTHFSETEYSSFLVLVELSDKTKQAEIKMTFDLSILHKVKPSRQLRVLFQGAEKYLVISNQAQREQNVIEIYRATDPINLERKFIISTKQLTKLTSIQIVEIYVSNGDIFFCNKSGQIVRIHLKEDGSGIEKYSVYRIPFYQPDKKINFHVMEKTINGNVIVEMGIHIGEIVIFGQWISFYSFQAQQLYHVDQRKGFLFEIYLANEYIVGQRVITDDWKNREIVVWKKQNSQKPIPQAFAKPLNCQNSCWVEVDRANDNAILIESKALTTISLKK